MGTFLTTLTDKTFLVVLHGQNIDLPHQPGSPHIIGFHALRRVRAATSAQAAQRAVDAMQLEWEEEGFADIDQGPGLRLEAEEVRQKRGLSSLLGPAGTQQITFYKTR